MSEEWGPWIEHDGTGCPVPVGTKCELGFRCGCQVNDVIDARDFSGLTDWKPLRYSGCCSYCNSDVPAGALHIIRYRVSQPRALTDLKAMNADPVSKPAKEHTE